MNEINQKDNSQIDKVKEILQKDDSINIDYTNDDYVIISSWDDVKRIEDITGLKIDDVFNNWVFSDEYTTCDQCHNHIELNPYSGRDYAIIDNELICGDCIRDEYDINNPNNHSLIDEFLTHIVNNHKTANNILTDKILDNLGFKKCSCKDNEECSFDNGLHIGMNDDPAQILKNAIKKNPGNDYIFDINNIDMFNVNFTIWSRSKVSMED